MVTIIAASTYNRPDFIPLQYESFKKHVKCDFKYIVINNAKFSFIDSTNDSGISHDQINKICRELDIECHEVTYSNEVLSKTPTGTIVNGRYNSDPYACCYSIQWTFEYIIPKLEDKVFIVDSDLFFINDIDLEELLDEYDLGYIPQHRGLSIMYMWNMFCGFDFKKRPDLRELNWTNCRINGVACDVGSNTHFFLRKNTDLKQLFLEEHSLYQITNRENNVFDFHYQLNGNSNYRISIDVTENKIKEFHRDESLLLDKTFPYELDFVNYPERIKSVIIEILNTVNSKIDKNFLFEDLPHPLRLGFVKKFDEDCVFAIHYRSAANYHEYSTIQYNVKKTELLKKILR